MNNRILVGLFFAFLLGVARADDLGGDEGLTGLWAWDAIAHQPLDVQVVYSRLENGYRIEGLYLNGVGDGDAKDRIFVYYARPEKPQGKIPVVLSLTGGGASDTSCLWAAQHINGACVDIEYRSRKSQWHSVWVGGTPKYRDVGPLKAQQPYRIVSAARRVLDFLSQQDFIDQTKVASMGGSLGGIYTLLLAGVDSRITAGVASVAFGHMDGTDCAQSAHLDDLGPAGKKLWLEAFDPASHATAIRARILVNSSTNDHFCALEGIVDTYRDLPGDKRFALEPNYDHENPGFGGQPKYQGFVKWLPYCFGDAAAYVKVPDKLQNDGSIYHIHLAGQETQRAILCWSPGGMEIPWQARYWVEIEAKREQNGWQAEIPAAYADLPGFVFMNVYSEEGQLASSLPQFRSGTFAPRLWAGGQLWDMQSGLAAWRSNASENPLDPRKASIQVTAQGGLIVGPYAGANQPELPGLQNSSVAASGRFIVLTNSVSLVSGLALHHAGMVFKIDGRGLAGELKISLFRNFNSSFHEQKFEHVIKYDPGVRIYELPWGSFRNSRGLENAPFPFDTLQIEGTRADGSALGIETISFLD